MYVSLYNNKEVCVNKMKYPQLYKKKEKKIKQY